MVKVKKKEKYSNEKKFYQEQNKSKDEFNKYELHFYMRDKNYCCDEKNQKGKNITTKYKKLNKCVMLEDADSLSEGLVGYWCCEVSWLFQRL